MAKPKVTLAPRRRRSAKIVATLGPASSTPEQIAALFASGVDVFRLNFSHGPRRTTRRASTPSVRWKPGPAAPSA